MAGLKSLAKDTAIYGLSSIVGRFLNYMLVPLYTAVLPASTGGYGVVSNVYAFTALMLVLLTFGMETGFFRFANKSGEDPMKVYANSLVIGRRGIFDFCFPLPVIPATHFQFTGLWRSSGVYSDDGCCGSFRLFPMHSFCLFTV